MVARPQSDKFRFSLSVGEKRNQNDDGNGHTQEEKQYGSHDGSFKV
jgi:hypothetical protein